MSALAFRYKALDGGGSKRSGSLEATSSQEAFRRLAALGLTPISIIESSAGSRVRGRRAKAKDVAHFTQQLAVLINARISISEALMSIAEQERNQDLKRIISDIAVRIESGEPMAGAMAAHRRVFGEVYIETVRTAERSGNLVKVLDHLAEMLEKQAEMTRQWRGALMYPMCVCVVLVVAIVFLVGFVIPQFATIFETRGVELPMLTRVLMTIGKSMQAHWFMYLGGAAAAVFGLREAWRRPAGRALIDRLIHKAPLFNTLLIGNTMSRFARVLGLTLGSGLPLTDCLVLAGRSAGRPMLKRDTETLLKAVTHGSRLVEAFPSCTYLTPFAKRMLTAGEESAELNRMCGVICRHYDQETTYLTKTLATVLEPILVVAIAGIVLIVALAVFIPMWDMVKLIQ